MIDATERRGAAIEPREIKQEGDVGLRVTWADDRVCHYTAAGLRGGCPCAQCVNEWTGQRVLKPESVAKEALFPATLAQGVSPWPRLLQIAKDDRRPLEVRTSAVFWLGQGTADEATKGLADIVDADGDRDVRKSAVFSLSQRPKDEAVPALLRIARTHRDPELRRSAIFWLGQTRDPRVLAYFEEVLLRR